SFSARMILEKASAVRGFGSSPCLARCVTSLGEVNAALADEFNFATISGDVPLGASIPFQPTVTQPGTVSLTVGISVNELKRLSLNIPRGRTSPAITSSLAA